jgi:hypothetical protein
MGFTPQKRPERMKLLVRNPLPIALLCGLAFLNGPAAQAEILTPEQIAKIVAELNRVQTLVTGKRLEGRRNAVDAFRRAAASDKDAYEFYLACAKEVEFDQQGKSSTDFREWRERQEAKLKTPSRMTALRLQLQYLVLTLRVSEGESPAKLLPEVEAFLASIVTNAEGLEGDLALLQRESVLATPFAKVYELDQSVKMTEWSYMPGNIGQAYDKFILPLLRKEHPELVAAAWERRIQLETQLAQTVRKEDPVGLEKFANEALPRLQFRRAEDMFKIGQQQEASLAMLKLLTDHSEHPDASTWIDDFRELLVPPAPEPK